MKEKHIEINYPFSLAVGEGRRDVLIGSEIEPIKIGEKVLAKEWDNGPTTYRRESVLEYFFILQHGKPLVIERYFQRGDYASLDESWEAYSLPDTLQVDRWLPEEK